MSFFFSSRRERRKRETENEATDPSSPTPLSSFPPFLSSFLLFHLQAPQPTLHQHFEPRRFRGFRHRTTKQKITTSTNKAAQTSAVAAQGGGGAASPALTSAVVVPAASGVAINSQVLPPAADGTSLAASSETGPVVSAPVQSSSAAAPVVTGAVNNGGVGGGGGASPGTDTGAGAGGGDLQSSLTHDPSVINENFKDNGQNPPVAGQVTSLTSSNNYINFCASQAGVPLTNGLQIKDGSCNQAPMGRIFSINRIPSCKFIFPKNLDAIQESTPFTIQLKINKMNTGQFVNAQKAYFAAPAQVDDTGTILGHSHVSIEQIDSLESTTVLNPLAFAFFKGLNSKANSDRILTADVPAGLKAGFYKMSSINSAANHQPVLVAVAQHGSSPSRCFLSYRVDSR